MMPSSIYHPLKMEAFYSAGRAIFTFLVLPLGRTLTYALDLSGDLPCPWSILEFIPFICMLCQLLYLGTKEISQNIEPFHWSISYFLPQSVCEILID